LVSASPSLFYDYYGFPEEVYELKYPAPGSPKLAETIMSLFEEAGIPSRIDEKRGFDHGLYISLKRNPGDDCARVPSSSGG